MQNTDVVESQYAKHSGVVGFTVATGSGILANVLSALVLSDMGWASLPSIAIGTVTVILVLRYWTIIGYGGFPPRSRERRAYNRLRTGLRRGSGGVGAFYELGLQRALAMLDRGLGDRGRQGDPRLARLFKLRTNAPLWTAESYDRCLMFALVYPVSAVVGGWGLWGHVGPAEEAMRLPLNLAAYLRTIVVIGFVVLLASWIMFMIQSDWRRHLFWFLLTMVGMSTIFAGTGAGPRTFAFGFALSIAFAIAVARVVRRSGINAIRGAGAGGMVFAATSAILIGMGGAQYSGINIEVGIVLSGIIAFAIATIIAVFLARGGRSGLVAPYMMLLSFVAFMGALLFPLWFASLPSWRFAGAITLFLVLLTIINAPFDWFAIGLTRAWLRRGLERGGLWPLWYGVLDLGASVLLVVALAVVTTLCVQSFEQITLAIGAEPIVRVEEVLSDIRRQSFWELPEYWWIYVMLFSTMLPSVVNVSLGALSVMRGIPAFHSLLGNRMPRGHAVLISERWWLAPVLAGQALLSILIGIGLMFAVFAAVLIVELPTLGPLLAALVANVAGLA